ncbi:hypothetical protein AX17_002478 [Amanita inopinata Kibby_2008]|nr:hypothetical protein AX17_002478 [Amanita inopinata Kibby_2008]
MAQASDANAIVINMDTVDNPSGPATTTTAAANTSSSASGNSRKLTQEPLFGPNIGFVSSGPSWAITHEKKVVTDDLTPQVVKGWIEKSKQTSYPTTTLQALVNLKRPTLRLSPLSSLPDDHSPGDDTQPQHHGLEFEYDCDAPKCGIYVHVLLPKDHPDAVATASSSGYSKLLVFETVTEGGFGRLLKLEDGAMLELGRFEQGKARAPSQSQSQRPTSLNAPLALSADASSSAVSNLGSGPVAGASSPTSGNEAAPLASGTTAASARDGATTPDNRARRRFTHFHFRKKTQNRSVSGPALAVVDMAEPSTNGEGEQGEGGRTGTAASEQTGTGAGAATPAAAGTGAGGTAEKKKKKGMDDDRGVRVTIRLAALDDMGTELMSPNEQVTYLHIVRFGMKDPIIDDGNVENTRPFVVRVVKREATIGPHTFHLHEIYGLTSSSTSAHAHKPTAPLPSQEHSYPPQPSSVSSTTPLADAPVITPSGVAPGGEDESSSECLLCLSAPREVVLLPCRHLVACRECALNMVEFGAGGTITQPNEEPAAPTGASAAAGGSGGDAGAAGGEGGAGGTGEGAAGVGTTTTTTNLRRKRRAKGWYCPVCRQPYTSLLRITNHPPAAAEGGQARNDDEGHAHAHGPHDGHDHGHDHAHGGHGHDHTDEMAEVTSGVQEVRISPESIQRPVGENAV